MKLLGFLVMYFAVLSVVTFAVYAKDKSAAMNNRWRVEESTLHFLALAGGWPAAFVAQKILRHKSKKSSFQKVYIATILLNCVVVTGIATSL